MNKLNNKGYMLIEIILAVSLAMSVGYFLIELTLKVKNTNDDLLVASLARTDQGIIYNMIMEDVYNNPTMSVDEIHNKIKITGKKIEYGSKVNILSDYVTIGNITKGTDRVTIELEVSLLPEENFDVVIYALGDALIGYESEIVY